jgi:cytoskeletal protein RodZ
MRRHLMERQGPTVTSTSSASTASASSSAASSGATPGPSSANSTITHPTVVLASTNPTAVPLSSIVSMQASAATVPLPATPVAGTLPSGISGAPPLPDG